MAKTVFTTMTFDKDHNENLNQLTWLTGVTHFTKRKNKTSSEAKLCSGIQ